MQQKLLGSVVIQTQDAMKEKKGERTKVDSYLETLSIFVCPSHLGAHTAVLIWRPHSQRQRASAFKG